ncbi:MAG: amidohydrolase family protein, partial [Bacteroidales bacterium]|nr:amidohydrolase family protein [Bacteroidales bacterium]
EKDAEIFAKQGAVAVHNPCSNMKLSSGVFNMPLMKEKKCNITLGTDGCSSNNNLSMIEEMKFACLLSKVTFQKADALSAKEVYKIATINGAKAYNINAGEIKEGMLADFILVDLDNERLQPLHNIIYNIVYSADSSCVDTVVCNGKVLMQNRKVENEEEIIEIAKRYAKV